jgi:hypothetical protein
MRKERLEYKVLAKELSEVLAKELSEVLGWERDIFMNRIIKMFLLLNVVREILLFSTFPASIYMVELFPELDSDGLWKEKIKRDKLLLLPYLRTSFKEYYTTLSRTESLDKLEIDHPLIYLEDDFIYNLYYILGEKAGYLVHSLKEKKSILCQEMQKLESKTNTIDSSLMDDLSKRKREIEEVCFNFYQGHFCIGLKGRNVRSHLFNSAFPNRKLLFLFSYYHLE